MNLFLILTITFSFLYLFGLVPESLKMIIGRVPGLDYRNNQTGELPLSIKIPAISVLLTNHTDIEWNKNLAGIKALLKLYTK